MTANLKQMLELRVQDVEKNGEALFSAIQNAYIISSAETYYRSMFAASENGWNIRDGHMMDTLDRLLENSGEGAKGIVWAHNTHIGDYRATDMEKNGYINLGGLARQSYGIERNPGRTGRRACPCCHGKSHSSGWPPAA